MSGITKAKFHEFEALRRSGFVNMAATRRVADLSVSLEDEDVREIRRQHGKFFDLYETCSDQQAARVKECLDLCFGGG